MLKVSQIKVYEKEIDGVQKDCKIQLDDVVVVAKEREIKELVQRVHVVSQLQRVKIKYFNDSKVNITPLVKSFKQETVKEKVEASKPIQVQTKQINTQEPQKEVSMAKIVQNSKEN